MTTLTENDVTFKKEIVSVEVANVGDLTDVVRQVYWRYVAEWTNPDGDVIRAKTYINQVLNDPDQSNFVTYDSLNADTLFSFFTILPEDEQIYKETVLAWLNDQVIGIEEVEEPVEEVRETRSWI